MELINRLRNRKPIQIKPAQALVLGFAALIRVFDSYKIKNRWKPCYGLFFLDFSVIYSEYFIVLCYNSRNRRCFR